MPRETQDARRRRATEVFDRLGRSMPEARIELDYETPWNLLVAVILAAQCTDKRVNQVTPALFRRWKDPAAFATADRAELEEAIRSCGFFRMKAKAIQETARRLVAEHAGEVPSERAVLAGLPGVGQKTAGVVAVHVGGAPAFPVDTHVGRLSRRLGFARELHPDKVELAMQRLLPPERWAQGHQLLVWHGRRTCFARKPACERCVVADLCPKVGVATRRGKLSRRGPRPTRRPGRP